MATFRFCPPHSMTRVNSQIAPFETASVERSWPTLATTIAALAGIFGRSPRGRGGAQSLEIDAGELDSGLPQAAT